MNAEVFERIVGSISDLSLTITLQQFEWGQVAQGTISKELETRIMHQVHMQMAEHLHNLSLSQKSSLLALAGWEFVNIESSSMPGICVYNYRKVLEGVVYRTQLFVEMELPTG